MHITHLSVTNFKNIEAAELDFSPNLNCFVGDNGAGKTNLLDALYYLSMAKSCFGGSDSLHIRHDAPFFLLQGRYRRHDGDETVVACGVRRGEGKVLKRDNKTYDRLSDHLGFIPLVIISPADNEWINESGEERRKYLNTLLVQIDREYLHALTRYNHLLAQRNKLLKAPTAAAELLPTLDEQLAPPAALIHQRRKALVAGLQPYFNTIYQSLSGNKEQAALDYRSALDDAPFDELLRRAADRDRFLQHTTVGVHRDDVAMLLDGYPLRRTGSQGQQKTFLIALKLAQYEFLKHANGRRPLLLLDDIFDKLDERRVQQLITLVAHETFGQIFLTDSNKIRLNHIVRERTQDYCIFQTRGGAFSRLPNGGSDSEGTS